MAAVLLLIAVVLVHAVAPHHAPVLLAAEAKPHVLGKPQAERDSADAQVHHPAHLHHDPRDPVALPSRTQTNIAAVGEGTHADASDGAAPSGTAVTHVLTARDRHNPTGASAPTLSILQTFRC
ncbi:hypothetical protein ACIQOF_36230 [Streptomyces sp. NPDC091265]|uniref:hypothetical protein n=1 Tax=unclassified Streptomyces TaxID=2593676 RepID=UPI003450E0FF